ncbi:MAG TPA: SRPBCC domain-containing protein [Vicinamibacterales bacterium]|nr:SRPBCC domain-containing protein [Vicinamibacterales bacterium]
MRFYPETFRITASGDRTIEIERDLNAPRALVFDAFTKPELVRRWLLGPEGWTMPVCEIELRVGGRYRYVWHKASTGHRMGLGGEFLEIVRPERLVATERFDDAWYPGEAVNTTVFEEQEGVTTVRLSVRYESTEARDTASRSGMEQGIMAGYDRLERLLSSLPQDGGTLRVIEGPVVTETTAQLAAAIHVTVPRHEIQSVMGPGLTEILQAVKAQGIGPAGPWFTHHFRTDPATFDFEICVPVSSPVSSTGRVVGREVPSLKVVQAVYRGPYERLGSAWAEFNEWIAASGHEPGPDFYECYPVGPESTPDSAEWRTELRRPVLETRA